MSHRSYFNSLDKDFNPYQVLTVHPTELGIFGSHTFHELMMADSARVTSYLKALKQIGKKHPHLTCVDVGSGLAPLTVFCARFGLAKKVYAIEQEATPLRLS